MACYRPQVHKQIVAVMRKHVPTLQSFVALPSEQEALKEEIFAAQHWASLEEHVCVGPSPFGIGEARYLAGGSCIVAGVLMDKLPGKNLTEKNERLMTDAGLKIFLEKVMQSKYVVFGLSILIVPFEFQFQSFNLGVFHFPGEHQR
jgi:hypothetical protein